MMAVEEVGTNNADMNKLHTTENCAFLNDEQKEIQEHTDNWKEMCVQTPSPKTGHVKRHDAAPSTLMVAKTIQNQESRKC